MPLPPDFNSRLAAMPDRKLLEMIGHGDDYQPEALAAAQEELRHRKLNPEIALEVEASLEAEAGTAQARADKPLPLVWRIVNVLFPFGILQMLIAGRYRSKGFVRCGSECWLWIRRGLLFWVVTFAVIAGIDLIWPIGDHEWVGWIVELIAFVFVIRMPVPAAVRVPAAQPTN